MEKSQSPFIGRDNGTKESMRTESLPLPGSIAYGDLPQFPKHGVLPFRRTIRRHELRQIVPLAETTIYEMERRGEFPRRFNLTPRCVVWDLAEVRPGSRSASKPLASAPPSRMYTCEKPALFGRVPVRNEAGDGLIQREIPAPWKLSAITAAPPWPR